MRVWVFMILGCFNVTSFAQQDCSILTLLTAPALKAYRDQQGKCVLIRKGVVNVASDFQTLTLFSVSNCRDMPMPVACEIEAADLSKADTDGDCTVKVRWQIDHKIGAVCSASDK